NAPCAAIPAQLAQLRKPVAAKQYRMAGPGPARAVVARLDDAVRTLSRGQQRRHGRRLNTRHVGQHEEHRRKGRVGLFFPLADCHHAFRKTAAHALGGALRINRHQPARLPPFTEQLPIMSHILRPQHHEDAITVTGSQGDAALQERFARPTAGAAFVAAEATRLPGGENQAGDGLTGRGGMKSCHGFSGLETVDYQPRLIVRLDIVSAAGFWLLFRCFGFCLSTGDCRLATLNYPYPHSAAGSSRDWRMLARTWVSSARMAMAISAGVLLPMGRPMGACRRSRSASVMSSCCRRRRRLREVAAEPMAPM